MTTKIPAPRRSVLDLAPLELDCMNTLWPMGEGTVRQIRDQLAERRPRAYTTIMTIMDRLARKGVVERRKFGRAYIYRANLTAEEARSQALGQVLENFFGGSRDALLEQLANAQEKAQRAATPARAAAAAGSGVVLTMPSPTAAPREPRATAPTAPARTAAAAAAPAASAPRPAAARTPAEPDTDLMDDTLL